jgi:hypothetical protein
MRTPHHDAIPLVIKRPPIYMMVNDDNIVAEGAEATSSSKK